MKLKETFCLIVQKLVETFQLKSGKQTFAFVDNSENVMSRKITRLIAGNKNLTKLLSNDL